MKEQKRKKRKKTLKIVGALMGVFLLIGCCSIGGLAFLGSDGGAPTPAVVVTAAASSTPALTPTIAPTFTPQPTADGTSQYREEMIKLVPEVVDCMERWAELCARVSDNPTLTSDSEWRGEFRSVAGEMQGLNADTYYLPSPPPEFRPSHDKFIQAMRHYSAAADLSILWLDANDPDTLIEAVVEIGLGNIAITEAATLMPD